MFKYVFSHNFLEVFFMANMTLAIPNPLRDRMKKHSEVRWSEIAREAFEKRVEELEWMDKVLKNSEFTEEDAEEIGHKIKSEIRKRFEKRFGSWN